MQSQKVQQHRFNFTVNILDGAMFGMALGFASFSTVIPLFISSLSDSAILIGMVSAVHVLGWQLPQLFIAPWLARKTYFKPLVMVFTLQERLPFLGLAVVAFLIPTIGNTWGIVLAFLMLTWQAIGGGFTANPWQLMIHKIIFPEVLTTFFGMQAAAMNLLAAAGAVISGLLLDRIPYPHNYALTFLIASFWLAISYAFLNATREPEGEHPFSEQNSPSLWKSMITIFQTDPNFIAVLGVRILGTFGMMASSFYSVYAVNQLGASKTEAGILTSVLMISSVVMNLFLGWLADHWSHRKVLEIGVMAMFLSAILAALAPSFTWFYPVMFFTGISNTAMWTIMMAYVLTFGEERQKPLYVGMANTLITPFTFTAPILGGWLANSFGYPATFWASSAAAIFCLIILHFFVREHK
ncbi:MULTISPECIES: MFS transporter [Anaerolinea]|uniref:MFS transporter n=1 Tax=Anaerolinea TaxID=233189 RepID=UPI00262B8B61|nr:MFS transporter [Anaerolinea thermophila]